MLEAIPAELASRVSGALEIPTIGIGAGAGCDGQVLVTQDILGLYDAIPSFAKVYAELGRATVEAAASYAADVREGRFPEPEA